MIPRGSWASRAGLARASTGAGVGMSTVAPLAKAECGSVRRTKFNEEFGGYAVALGWGLDGECPELSILENPVRSWREHMIPRTNSVLAYQSSAGGPGGWHYSACVGTLLSA